MTLLDIPKLAISQYLSLAKCPHRHLLPKLLSTKSHLEYYNLHPDEGQTLAYELPLCSLTL